ncbi:MAG: hypothetical protein L6R42_010649 [Xanthoria sp. 1 TBL-2021]|nr:MAG: hypothetical protein L6R42_010649 [Xanthoria sp. 1 TBL-2021]
MPWQSYPTDLQILEMLDPVPSYPIVTDLYLRDQQFAQPLSHFRNLKVLDIQNVGAPICEVLWNLCESGKNLKCNGQGALRFADKVWSTKLKSFTMVASISDDIYKYSVRPTEYKSVPGSQSEWCVMSRGSSDTTGHEQNSLYLRERFEE